MEENTFSEIELNYGEILFEKSNAKSIYDVPTGRVDAKGWAQRIYMIILGTGLFGWFLYSLIIAVGQNGIGKAIVGHLLAFFVLLIAEFILLLTAFGGWGKFSRAALRHKSLTRKHRVEGVRTRAFEEELKAADANKANECAIRVYREYIVVINRGEKTVLPRYELERVQCDARSQGYQITFITYNGKEVVAQELLPISDLPIVKKHFERFDYTPANRGQGYLRKKFPLLAFMFIPILIGTALILLHCLVLHDMPIIFGILFVAFGVLFMIAQFSDVPAIKHGIMPIGGGIIIAAMPLGVIITITDLTQLSITALLATFTAIHAVLALFLGFGPLLIILGIAGLVDCSKM